VRNAATKHTARPCLLCDCITVRQPWATLIALGLKSNEYRSRHYRHEAMSSFMPSQWYAGMRPLVLAHFADLSRDPERLIDALFPLSKPVAEVTITGCVPVHSLPYQERMFGGLHEDGWALRLADARIITKPKPVLRGLQSIPWRQPVTRKLADALARAWVLAGEEKDKIFREFGLLQLAAKIDRAILEES